MDLEETIQDLAPRLLRYCLGRTGDRAGVLDIACAQVKCQWRLTEGSKPVLEIKPK